jgi:hypothetical protein
MPQLSDITAKRKYNLTFKCPVHLPVNNPLIKHKHKITIKVIITNILTQQITSPKAITT